MADLELTEITKAGVQHLENWLHENGYSEVTKGFLQATSADILANGKTENILVQLKTTLFPAEQALPNGTDKFALKELALRLDRVPYIAYLVIADDKSLIGEINWERLT
jgi:hypothetical protein